jgi:hypothetical protein
MVNRLVDFDDLDANVLSEGATRHEERAFKTPSINTLQSPVRVCRTQLRKV